ncbi:iron-containing redox enzyme family protein [Leptolyngbya ohadii]|uniref:iron-containing redox enzyme family protein n=1 Tax=Leptolyngbya ohadii TaxID=1962290 RepID=UPI000B59C9CF|nr:iron-containing redox enzyme family protein [Leptolyngbya ohadii]
MIETLSPDRWMREEVRHSPNATPPNYKSAEKTFVRLLENDSLDQRIKQNPEIVNDFEAALAIALETAYGETVNADASLFLQRILYRINRLNLFWFDSLQNYRNERSFYIQWVRDRIEEVWQAWETSQMDIEALKQIPDFKQALIDRADADLEPPITESKQYIREEMSLEGYRWLLAIASLDGLVEASRMSRILGGASNEVHAMLIRVLMEEYGNGRYNKKHSTFYANMMAELGLNTTPEGYFDLAPWELLACVNHNFLLTERKLHFLRYNGGLTYFEIVGPSIYRDYMTAAQRLNLSDTAMGYWELHIREDERHGKWMVEQVALPLVDMYPDNAWEIVLGYDQEKALGDRAGAAIVNIIRAAEKAGTVL